MPLLFFPFPLFFPALVGALETDGTLLGSWLTLGDFNNVHDTSCFRAEITGREDENLNNVLMQNGIEQNHTRGTYVYKVNPAFCASRPLTQKIIDWASADVDRLFELATKQL